MGTQMLLDLQQMVQQGMTMLRDIQQQQQQQHQQQQQQQQHYACVTSQWLHELIGALAVVIWPYPGHVVVCLVCLIMNRINLLVLVNHLQQCVCVCGVSAAEREALQAER